MTGLLTLPDAVGEVLLLLTRGVTFIIVGTGISSMHRVLHSIDGDEVKIKTYRLRMMDSITDSTEKKVTEAGGYICYSI